MCDLIDIEIAEALKALRGKYPDQEVAIRVTLRPNTPCEFVAAVQYLQTPGCYECTLADSAHEAVERLIRRCGDRKDSRFARLKQLQAELESLQRNMKSLGMEACGDNEVAEREGIGHHQPTV